MQVELPVRQFPPVLSFPIAWHHREEPAVMLYPCRVLLYPGERILPTVIWTEAFAPLKYELPGEATELLSVPYNLINTTIGAGAGHGGPHLQ